MTLLRAQSKSLPSSRRPRRKPGSTTPERPTRSVALAEAKDDLSRYLRLAATEEIVITRHGRPAGVIIGFETEDDWFDYRLENHPEFLGRIAAARAALAAGQGIRLEELETRPNKALQPPSRVGRVGNSTRRGRAARG